MADQRHQPQEKIPGGTVLAACAVKSYPPVPEVQLTHEALDPRPWGTFQNLEISGGFNPMQKYESDWIIPPGRDQNLKKLKPPPSEISGGSW